MSENNHFLYDPETEEVIDIRKTITVGRSDSNGLPIKDQSVSSKHARLIIKEDGLYVEDLNSFNSTYVNGSELIPEKPIKLGTSDVVQFGDKRYYYNANEPCQAFLDLPTMTGTFKIGDKTNQGIVHNYDEPILDTNKQKKSSLKHLRFHKEEIEQLKAKLHQLNDKLGNGEKIHSKILNKEKEMVEFSSYLEAKSYNSQDEVNSIIQSIEEVTDRLDIDKNNVEEKIDILRNQIEDLNQEVEDLENEKIRNKAMVKELLNDVEIIKGRDLLNNEINQLNESLKVFNEKNYQLMIGNLQREIEIKEKEFKEAQKKYSDSRFGQKSPFGKKAS
ncbi:MAG: FHA domain-containing protein [Bacteriovoracaceae bacterium]|nr:FHA domain-containing protein [Bacteriovoracaceae bacterium]